MPPPKVPRYRPGKLPEYVKADDAKEKKREQVSSREERGKVKREIANAEILQAGEDSGEEDLAPMRVENEEMEITNDEGRQRAHQKIAVPVIVSKAEESSEGSEDEEDHDLRRQRLKERARQRQLEEEQGGERGAGESSPERRRREEMAAPSEREQKVAVKREATIKREQEEEQERGEEEEEEEEEDEEDSEEEDDSEEDGSHRMRIAPVFRKKEERDTLEDQKKLLEEQEALEEEKKKREEARKQESKELLKQELAKAEEQTVTSIFADDPDLALIAELEIEENEAEEYEKWKIRELARIKREQKEREDQEREIKELERRRNMTDAEIAREDALKLAEKPKKKWKFLQKYYHKGAFFRTFDERDEMGVRDFSQPTLEDKFDKAILPKVMQVKNFGRSGRTKYTHLVDQDTTNFETPWLQSDSLGKKYISKMAGMGSVVTERPEKKQKTSH